tara:strand:+ start:3556 stop:4398 length:843 start_codon:yes stop_codon:yes gene_type:complete
MTTPDAPAPVAEQTTTPAAEAAPTPEAAPTADPAKELSAQLDAGIDIEGLANAKIEDPVFQGENHKVKYDEVIASLPDDAKKIVANLRSSYTKKTQEYAELRKAATLEREAISAQRKALFDSESFQKLEEASKKDPSEWDPYSKDSFESRVQLEVAKQMKNVLEPMRERQELQTRQSELRSFREANPDLVEYKHDVAKLLTKNKHLSLEDAYWQVKGHKLAEKEKESQVELSRYKKAAKSAGLKVGGANRGSANGIPKYVLDQDDPVAIYNWLKENKTSA